MLLQTIKSKNELKKTKQKDEKKREPKSKDASPLLLLLLLGRTKPSRRSIAREDRTEQNRTHTHSERGERRSARKGTKQRSEQTHPQTNKIKEEKKN
jgi:hypothetical protein